MTDTCDFMDYIVRYDRLYTSGHIFRKAAFKSSNGHMVPITYGTWGIHTPGNILGSALLENTDDGVIAKCTFFNSDIGKIVKNMVTDDTHGLTFCALGIERKDDIVTSGWIQYIIIEPKEILYE